MQHLFHYVLLSIVNAVSSRHITFHDNDIPIQFVNTSYGLFDHERVDYLEAIIYPHHLVPNGRINFPTSGYLNDYYVEARAYGDERGHLVGPQFSGPATWYNLTPQNVRVNRNIAYQAITTDWYGAECKVRKFLNEGGNRKVIWKVTMTYILNSNRPHEYHLEVQFINNEIEDGPESNYHIGNPFLVNDSTFWLCRSCRRYVDSGNQCQRQ